VTDEDLKHRLLIEAHRKVVKAAKKKMQVCHSLSTLNIVFPGTFRRGIFA
jgi:hypothetical protein